MNSVSKTYLRLDLGWEIQETEKGARETSLPWTALPAACLGRQTQSDQAWVSGISSSLSSNLANFCLLLLRLEGADSRKEQPNTSLPGVNTFCTARASPGTFLRYGLCKQQARVLPSARSEEA